MLKLITSILSLGFLSLPLIGCAAQAEDPSVADEDVVESTEDALKGNMANRNYFQVVRRDYRKCAAPLCGGFWVRRVNKDGKGTMCADGIKRPECYVADINLSGLGLSSREQDQVRGALESGRVLLRARMDSKKAFGTLVGSLAANEAWLGMTGSPSDGQFFRVVDNGIRCITTPCPSTTAHVLNSVDPVSYNLIDVKFDALANPADPATLDRATRAIATKEGLIVVGGVAIPKCIPNTNCGPWVSVSEFYLPVKRTEGRYCGVRGALMECGVGQYCAWKAGDLCGAADAPGKCAFKTEICTKIYQPVCGCDGNTYGNACMAAAAEMSIVSNGECPAENEIDTH